MEYDFPTQTVTLDRPELDIAVIVLNERSSWYAVTPIPDDLYQLTFKAGEGIEGELRRHLPLLGKRDAPAVRVLTEDGVAAMIRLLRGPKAHHEKDRAEQLIRASHAELARRAALTRGSV